jgi:Type II secretory pathway, ATPase PulE/Tfp pilus assembly pathway, ATPase PilB
VAESAVTPIRSHPVLRGLSQDGLCALDENQWMAVEQEARLAQVPVLFHAIKKDLITAARLMAYLSRRYRMPMLDLNAVQLDTVLIGSIDKKLMHRYLVLPLSKRGETLYLAMADPTDFKAVEDIKFNTGWQVVPILVEADKLMRAVHLITDAGTGIDDVFLEKPLMGKPMQMQRMNRRPLTCPWVGKQRLRMHPWCVLSSNCFRMPFTKACRISIWNPTKRISGCGIGWMAF